MRSTSGAGCATPSRRRRRPASERRGSGDPGSVDSRRTGHRLFRAACQDAQQVLLDKRLRITRQIAALTRILYNGGGAALADVAQARRNWRRAHPGRRYPIAARAERACHRRIARRESVGLPSGRRIRLLSRIGAPGHRPRPALLPAGAPPGCRGGRTPGRGRQRANRRRARRVFSGVQSRRRGGLRQHHSSELADAPSRTVVRGSRRV
jgi:hypothetical protein